MYTPALYRKPCVWQLLRVFLTDTKAFQIKDRRLQSMWLLACAVASFSLTVLPSLVAVCLELTICSPQRAEGTGDRGGKLSLLIFSFKLSHSGLVT